jgi:hypothetical protein
VNNDCSGPTTVPDSAVKRCNPPFLEVRANEIGMSPNDDQLYRYPPAVINRRNVKGGIPITIASINGGTEGVCDRYSIAMFCNGM